MTETKRLVRAYNELAMGLPDRAWTKRFAHPRMELVGTRVRLQYTVYQDHKFVPVDEPMPVEDIPAEIQRLRRRVAERK